MKIKGIDLTSAPSAKKPISCAEASLEGNVLSVHSLEGFTNFEAFEQALSEDPPWVAGIDFPFGQARRFLLNVGWPDDWASYVALVAGMSKSEFIELLERYKEDRPDGDKEHKREIDKRASSISPQKLYGVPVGKMFFEGAPRLLKSPASIIPVRPRHDPRIIVEAYPAILARRYIGRCSYKSDTRARQTPQLRGARGAILQGISSAGFRETYGFKLDLIPSLKALCMNDGAGDYLDAVLCCIQAAWAWMQRESNYGIPEGVDRAEGWIADPAFAGPEWQVGRKAGMDSD